MRTPLLNLSVLWVSIFVIIAIGLSALVWSTHLYTYAPKAQRPPDWRVFKEKGGFWSVIRDGFIIYTAEEGDQLGDKKANPLLGFIKSCGFSYLFLLGLLLILAASGKGSRWIKANGIWIYSVFLFIVGAIGLPYIFCFKTHLPERVFWGFPEAPYSPIWWGLLISAYGVAVLIKYTLKKDIISIAAEKRILPFSILGAPFWGLTTIGSFASLFLAPVIKAPHITTWFVFLASWLIGAVSCWILGIFLIIKAKR